MKKTKTDLLDATDSLQKSTNVLLKNLREFNEQYQYFELTKIETHDDERQKAVRRTIKIALKALDDISRNYDSWIGNSGGSTSHI